MADMNELIDALSGLTVMEVVELTKALEDKWGVKAAAGMPMMAMPAAGGAAGGAAALRTLAPRRSTSSRRYVP